MSVIKYINTTKLANISVGWGIKLRALDMPSKPTALALDPRCRPRFKSWSIFPSLRIFYSTVCSESQLWLRLSQYSTVCLCSPEVARAPSVSITMPTVELATSVEAGAKSISLLPLPHRLSKGSEDSLLTLVNPIWTIFFEVSEHSKIPSTANLKNNARHDPFLSWDFDVSFPAVA